MKSTGPNSKTHKQTEIWSNSKQQIAKQQTNKTKRHAAGSTTVKRVLSPAGCGMVCQTHERVVTINLQIVRQGLTATIK